MKNKSLEKTILIVEDDEISFLVLSEFLKRDSYNIIRAVNGKEAVAVVKKQKIHISLVLMDLLMPVMNGFDAAKQIKQISPNIPIIAQTAVTYNVHNNMDFSNFNSIMVKPLNFDNLNKQINHIIFENDFSDLMHMQLN
jgi:CheY-like chemotaxis protein